MTTMIVLLIFSAIVALYIVATIPRQQTRPNPKQASTAKIRHRDGSWRTYEKQRQGGALRPVTTRGRYEKQPAK